MHDMCTICDLATCLEDSQCAQPWGCRTNSACSASRLPRQRFHFSTHPLSALTADNAGISRMSWLWSTPLAFPVQLVTLAFQGLR